MGGELIVAHLNLLHHLFLVAVHLLVTCCPPPARSCSAAAPPAQGRSQGRFNNIKLTVLQAGTPDFFSSWSHTSLGTTLQSWL
jgi:hypothetical protein